jgi:hypothetical protein
MTARRVLGVALLTIVALTVACSGDDPPVAWVGDTVLHRSELETYLDHNLVQTELDVERDDEGTNRVKSRLLDAWIEELLLLDEATRAGIEVSEEEIDEVLELMAATPTDGESEADDPREPVRRRLMVQELLRAVRDAVPEPGPAEVEAYADVHSRRFADALRSFRVRSLRFDEEGDATSVHADITAGRVNFEDAAIARQLEAGLVPVDLAWSSIPGQIRPAIDALKPGEVSPPLTYGGNTYLFEMISRTPPTPGSEDLLRLAANELHSLQRGDADQALVERLRSERPVRLGDDLPFRYVAPDD